jgi:hypothetical protein
MAVRCKAKSKQTGEQCKQFAIAGGTVCVYHGGNAPNTRKAARERLAMMVDPALETLGYAMRKKDTKLREALTAAKEVLDRNPEVAAVHKYEDITPAAAMTSEERKKKIAELQRELYGDQRIQ